jgi:hypothetical protein
MKDHKNQSLTLMWFARICGLIISGIWLYTVIKAVLLGGFLALHHEFTTGIILFLLITTLSIGVLIAWRVPLAGGKFIIVLSVLLSIFIYFSDLNNRIIPILYQALPFFLVGLLFVQSQSTKKEGS